MEGRAVLLKSDALDSLDEGLRKVGLYEDRGGDVAVVRQFEIRSARLPVAADEDQSKPIMRRVVWTFSGEVSISSRVNATSTAVAGEVEVTIEPSRTTLSLIT